MRLIRTQTQFIGAQVRGSLYKRFFLPHYLKGAKPFSFEVGVNTFHGQSFRVTPTLYRLMGINPRFHDGDFKVVVLKKKDYEKYDRIKGRGRRSGGTYIPRPDLTSPTLIGKDILPRLKQLKVAKNTIVPEGAGLTTILHEALHDIYERQLSTSEVDDFIMTAARCYEQAADKRGLNRIRQLPERVLFYFVADHARIDQDNIVTTTQLERLRASDPGKPLRDLLDDRNKSFFTELFSMAGEIYFGFSYPLPNGRVSLPLQNYFDRIQIKR